MGNGWCSGVGGLQRTTSRHEHVEAPLAAHEKCEDDWRVPTFCNLAGGCHPASNVVDARKHGKNNLQNESVSSLAATNGMFAECCGGFEPTLALNSACLREVASAQAMPDSEEQFSFNDMQVQVVAPLWQRHDEDTPLPPGDSTNGDVEKNGTNGELSKSELHTRRRSMQWDVWRPLIMGVSMFLTVVISFFAQGWLDGEGFPGSPSLESCLRYGTIPVIAAIIGYGTNVLALQMMFYPLEFIGCLPQLKIGLGLDLFLCGWQGVIPMKAREMAEISVDMMTKKLIKVEDIFSRLDPDRCAKLVEDRLPGIVSTVLSSAGRENCPTLWEVMPLRFRSQLEQQVIAQSKPMMAEFILDLQNHISDVFDLKSCVVECMVSNRQLLVDMFQTCGAAEFEFIRISGFYLGFSFGLFQMAMWMFVKFWWILPLCGLFVGYFTNVIALKVIFLPVERRKVCCGFTVQGLFLQRQAEVSALYAKQVANTLLSADVLMKSLVNGPRASNMFELLDNHLSKCVETQSASYKQMLVMLMGADAWINFRQAVCLQFHQHVPTLLRDIEAYAQDTFELEGTLRTRMEKLPSPEFERLLHAVFEQDEIKLILVGALLGAIVGFLQAVVQTPEQLGLAF